jgi:hypothetical protein
MRRYSIVAVGICATLLVQAVLCRPAQSQDDAPANSQAQVVAEHETLELWFCWDSAEGGLANYEYVQMRNAAARFVQIAVTRGLPMDADHFKVIFDSRDACQQAVPGGGRTCLTQGNIMMCDAAVVARALRMVGWMTGLTMVSMNGGSIRSGGVPVQLARFLADAKSEEEILNALPRYWPESDYNFKGEDIALANAVWTYWVNTETGEELPAIEPEERARNSVLLAQLTADYVMAFLLGHEYYHTSQSCAGQSGRSAALEDLAAEQRRALALCDNLPNLEEVDADQCALQFVAGTHDVYNTRVDDFTAQFAERHAIDIVSQLVLGGLDSNEGVPAYRLPSGVELAEFHRPPGYLYAPLRAIAFAEQVEQFNTVFEVALCDTAALDVFRALTFAAYCEEEREFEYASSEWLTAFGQYFPRRTRFGLDNTPRPALNDEDDFACSPED